YMLDYGANHPTAVALPELLPLGFRDIELLAGLFAAQCALELGHDRILDQGGRNRFGGTGVPSILPRLLADVVTKPPATLGRVGRDHRPLAALAEQQSGEQRLLVRPDHVRALALPGSELSVDLFPQGRLDDRWVFPRIDRAAVSHLAGINRVGQKAAHRG